MSLGPHTLMLPQGTGKAYINTPKLNVRNVSLYASIIIEFMSIGAPQPPTAIDTSLVISENIVLPTASQKAAQTESSTRLVPTLLILVKGTGLPLKVHPILHVNRNSAQATATILLVKSLIRPMISSTGMTPSP